MRLTIVWLALCVGCDGKSGDSVVGGDEADTDADTDTDTDTAKRAGSRRRGEERRQCVSTSQHCA